MKAKGFIRVNGCIYDSAEYAKIVEEVREIIVHNLTSYLDVLGFVQVDKNVEDFHKTELIFNNQGMGLGVLFQMEKYEEDEFV